MRFVQYPVGAEARAPSISQECLANSVRTAMRSRRAPVAIVSTLDGGQPVGCAVSAFLSLSLRPPSLLISLRTGSATLSHIASSARFGLSLLAERHQPLIGAFSRGQCDDRFHFADFNIVHEVPLIQGAPAAFACRLSGQIGVRDHTLIVGDIVQVETAPMERAA